MNRCLSLLALLGSSAQAHHGIANFDHNVDIEVSGVITRIQFINPHSWLYLEVTDAAGETRAWRCELRGATVLRRSGWSEEMFPAGMPVRITGSPDRTEPDTCYTGTIFFPDGSAVDRYGQLESAPVVDHPGERPTLLADGSPNISGDWAGEQRVMTDPRGQMGTLVPVSIADSFAPGEVPGGGAAFPGARGTAISLREDAVDAYWNQRPSALPLTAAGAAVMADWDGASTDNPRLRCEPTNILFDWTFETDVNRIVQRGATITMVYGSMGIERTIYLDRQALPEAPALSRAGFSVGSWSGNTLTVETTRFEPGIVSADGRLPHGENMQVTEVFTFDPAAGSLARTYVAVDPEFFVGEFRGADTVYFSNLPFHGTTPCADLTYRDGAD